MNAQQFADLQDALMFVYGPILSWWLALLAASGVMSGVIVMWMRLLRWMSRK